MKREYKCSETRLVDYFESSRDKWKERSMNYQKEKKELLIEVRDLRRSRNKWKDECLKLKSALKEFQDKEKKTKELLQTILNQ